MYFARIKHSTFQMNMAAYITLTSSILFKQFAVYLKDLYRSDKRKINNSITRIWCWKVHSASSPLISLAIHSISLHLLSQILFLSYPTALSRSLGPSYYYLAHVYSSGIFFSLIVKRATNQFARNSFAKSFQIDCCSWRSTCKKCSLCIFLLCKSG